MEERSLVKGIVIIEDLTGEILTKEEIKDIRSRVEKYFKQSFGEFELFGLMWDDTNEMKLKLENVCKTVGVTNFDTLVEGTFVNNLKWLTKPENLEKLEEIGLDNFRLIFSFDKYQYGGKYDSFLSLGDECMFELKDGESTLVIASEENKEVVKVFGFKWIGKLSYAQLENLLKDNKSLFDTESIYRVGLEPLILEEMIDKLQTLRENVGAYMLSKIVDEIDLNEDPEVQMMLKLSKIESDILKEVIKKKAEEK